MLFGLCRKLDMEIVESEDVENLENEFYDADNFVFDLSFGTENMCVVLGKLSYPHKPVHYAACFVAVYEPEFCDPHRKIAI